MLMTEQGGRTYVAQSGLLSSDASLPTHKTLYAADKTAYTLSPDQNTLTVTLAAAPVNGVEVKIFTFKRDSYVIDVRATTSSTTATSRWMPPPTTACCVAARHRKAKAAWRTPSPVRPCTPKPASSRR